MVFDKKILFSFRPGSWEFINKVNIMTPGWENTHHLKELLVIPCGDLEDDPVVFLFTDGGVGYTGIPDLIAHLTIHFSLEHSVYISYNISF